ncbi:MAG: signal peptide peptidase SppA [Spirochaetota bacterium]
MNKDRQILITILAFLTLSIIVTVLQISMTLPEEGEKFAFPVERTGPGIGVVRIYEQISTASNSNAFGQQSGADLIVQTLDRYMNNPRIRAVVIRINSPGGSVSATQEIFQKVLELRKRNIPVIASLGDIAASGGYYIASGCDDIYANPGTLTGSIGVIIAAPSFRALFEEMGIDMNVIKSGEYKDILSSVRDLRDDERVLLQEVVDITYKQFLKDISLGRNMPIDDFEQYADGRIFTGTQAFDYGLVDYIGSFEDALNKAREQAGLKPDAPVYLDTINPVELFLGSLSTRLMPEIAALPRRNYSIVEYRYNP